MIFRFPDNWMSFLKTLVSQWRRLNTNERDKEEILDQSFVRIT